MTREQMIDAAVRHETNASMREFVATHRMPLDVLKALPFRKAERIQEEFMRIYLGSLAIIGF